MLVALNYLKTLRLGEQADARLRRVNHGPSVVMPSARGRRLLRWRQYGPAFAHASKVDGLWQTVVHAGREKLSRFRPWHGPSRQCPKHRPCVPRSPLTRKSQVASKPFMIGIRMPMSARSRGSLAMTSGFTCRCPQHGPGNQTLPEGRASRAGIGPHFPLRWPPKAAKDAREASAGEGRGRILLLPIA